MLPFFLAAIFAGLAISTASALAADASILKPPPGASVAIVVFEDLQSPECARAFPLIAEVAAAHHVPVVLYDFPLPRHVWSFEAAVWARYFDMTSAVLGNEFRKVILAGQDQMNHGNLQQWVQKFADANKITLPPAQDPDGKLAEKVKIDFALAQRIGVEHPPTVWVVSNNDVSPPFVEEIKDRDQFTRVVEEMQQKALAVPAASPAGKKKKATAKTQKKAS
jgi:protein-disulfide isomerase